MKVHIALVGINRSLSVTGESLVRELSLHHLFPADTTWSLTLIQPAEGIIDNPRSGESGMVESEISSEWGNVAVDQLNQASLDSELEALGLSSLGLTADWSHYTQSVQNLFRFLLALKKSYLTQIRANNPDFVVFCRPDLQISGKLALELRLILIAAVSALRIPVALLPAWGRSRGLNDRFAILNGKALGDYFLRVDKAADYFKKTPSANAEQLLKHSLQRVLTLNTVFTPMLRIRLHGRVEEEDRKLLTLGAFKLRLSIYRARLKRLMRRLPILWKPESAK